MNANKYINFKKYEYCFELCVIAKGTIIDFIKILNPFIDGKNGAVVLIDDLELHERLDYLKDFMKKSPLDIKSFKLLSKEIELIVIGLRNGKFDREKYPLYIESILEVTISESKLFLELNYDPFEEVKDRHCDIYISEEINRYIKSLTQRIHN